MKKIITNWEDFEIGCKDLAKQIKSSKFKPDVIFTLPRGGLPIATRLAHLLNIKQIIINIKPYLIRPYHKILFVDDIADSGGAILKNIPQNCNCKIATLHYKPKTSRVKPDYYFEETDNWIVYPWEIK